MISRASPAGSKFLRTRTSRMPIATLSATSPAGSVSVAISNLPNGQGGKPATTADRFTMTLPATTPILISADDNGAEHAATWGLFVEANRDCLDAVDLARIATAITAGETYRGGGGAEGLWTVRLSPTSSQAIIAEIARVDRLLDANMAALFMRVRCIPGGCWGFENAYARNQDLRIRRDALTLQRGRLQVLRDAAINREWPAQQRAQRARDRAEARRRNRTTALAA